MEVNWLAVAFAALSAFLLGGLWYGLLFGKRWQALMGLSDEQAQAGAGKVFAGAFALSLVAAATFALFLGRELGAQTATLYGLCAGLCWVSATLGILYLFGRKPFKLWLIDAGYCTLQFTLYGAILGAMG